ncbi:hypothetical protein ACLMJK_008697 [Lecanora helva]
MSDKSNPMTKEAAANIQSSQALGGKDMSSGGFAARAQGAADRNANAAAAAENAGIPGLTGGGGQGGNNNDGAAGGGK